MQMSRILKINPPIRDCCDWCERVAVARVYYEDDKWDGDPVELWDNEICERCMQHPVFVLAMLRGAE